MSRLRALLIVPVLLAAAPAVRADFIVYNQPSDFPVSGPPGVWASQIDNSVGGLGNFATAYDNFKLPVSLNVTDVHWQGGYFLAPGQPQPPFHGDLSGFKISFYANNGGQPPPLGTAPLATYQINNTANESFVGPEPGSGNGGNLVYNYSTTLPTPFAVQAGVQYWLAIQADVTNIEWGWHTASGPPIGPGDGVSYQDFRGDNNSPSQRFKNPDLAFALSSGTPVPEPASVALWGLVGGGLLTWYRRRKAAR